MSQPVSLTLTGVSISPWKNVNWRQSPFSLAIACTVTGTVTYSIETTMSDYLAGVTAIVTPTAITGLAATAYLTSTTPVRAWRLNILTGSGSVTAEAVQAGY